MMQRYSAFSTCYVGLWVLQYVNKAKNGLYTNMETLGQPTVRMVPLYIHYRSKNISRITIILPLLPFSTLIIILNVS